MGVEIYRFAVQDLSHFQTNSVACLFLPFCVVLAK